MNDGAPLPPADPALIAGLADWSPWAPFADALVVAPRVPGVYLAREGTGGPLVYVGMAGERRGQGIRGRIGIYSSGKAATSGLGEAALDRALADADWLEDRLAAVRAGRPERAKLWASIAIARADLHMSWATTSDRAGALALERAVLDALHASELWNRLR